MSAQVRPGGAPGVPAHGNGMMVRATAGAWAALPVVLQEAVPAGGAVPTALTHLLLPTPCQPSCCCCLPHRACFQVLKWLDANGVNYSRPVGGQPAR